MKRKKHRSCLNLIAVFVFFATLLPNENRWLFRVGTLFAQLAWNTFRKNKQAGDEKVCSVFIADARLLLFQDFAMCAQSLSPAQHVGDVAAPTFQLISDALFTTKAGTKRKRFSSCSRSKAPHVQWTVRHSRWAEAAGKTILIIVIIWSLFIVLFLVCFLFFFFVKFELLFVYIFFLCSSLGCATRFILQQMSFGRMFSLLERRS